MRLLPSLAAMSLVAGTASAVPLELTTNGDFETGDDTGFTSFPTSNSTFLVAPAFASTGLFGGEVNNPGGSPSSAVIKQANIGQGIVEPGDTIEISFDARGETAAGGVVFPEFFSELDGGGVSKAEILGGGPLPLSSAFQTFSFTTTAGDNVDGGVSLQFAVITGGDANSAARLEVDNVSVTVDVIPEPAGLAALGLGGLALLARRRSAA